MPLPIDAVLSPTERTEFEAVIAQAASTGAQAVRYFSEAGGVIVIGLMTDGRLETWFASPARNNVEAIAAQAIVMHGLAQASHALATLLTGADAIASDAIRKAAH
jgi:hypothetical protein